MAPITTVTPVFQPYPTELKKRLVPIQMAMTELSIKLIVSRDVVNSVIADLLVSLQYSIHTPEHNSGQVRFLVEPILKEVQNNILPNQERRKRWLAAFRKSLYPMHKVNEWTKGDPPTGYLALIQEHDPAFYELLDCLRHNHMCLEYLEFELPRLLMAANSLVKIMTGESSIYRIPPFPRLKLMGHTGMVLVANLGISSPSGSTSNESSHSASDQSKHQSSQSNGQSDSQPDQLSSQTATSTSSSPLATRYRIEEDNVGSESLPPKHQPITPLSARTDISKAKISSEQSMIANGQPLSTTPLPPQNTPNLPLAHQYCNAKISS
ncbi:hypothetical protein TWF506_009740 [Arthrobotrys conoides]|uniref:Uncharacterized protein n=1 Tax=Arthrobotrys conoides TaxID=74498 RepID=A0AAN8NLP1_9PEZI